MEKLYTVSKNKHRASSQGGLESPGKTVSLVGFPTPENSPLPPSWREKEREREREMGTQVSGGARVL